MNIDDMQVQAHANAVNKGFWEDDDPEDPSAQSILAKLALVVEEIGEAVSEVRTGHPHVVYYEHGRKPLGLPIELADIVIRIGDLCGALGISLDGAIKLKMAYNLTRPHKHGKTC